MATKEPVSEQPELKDYSLDVPMVELSDVIKFVQMIRDKGLETATMKDVAAGCGYKSPTSTPFYRRLGAARLFGLIGKGTAGLTTRATDYLKPDSEDAKTRAIMEAITSVPAYTEMIQKFQGKKLNADLVANGFEKSLKITSVGAKICAKTFQSSLKFAGLLSEDGVVKTPGSSSLVPPPVIPPAGSEEVVQEPNGNGTEGKPGDDSPKTQSHVLYLDRDKKRKFAVTAPITVSKAELARINGWLGFTLIVDEQPGNEVV